MEEQVKLTPAQRAEAAQLEQWVWDHIEEATFEIISLRAYQKATRELICKCLEALHHDKNGEFANLPRLIEDMKADHKKLTQAHADLIWMELTFDKMHKLLCPTSTTEDSNKRVEEVYERVLIMERYGPPEGYPKS